LIVATIGALPGIASSRCLSAANAPCTKVSTTTLPSSPLRTTTFPPGPENIAIMFVSAVC
jgi:hypothetical protein